MHSILVTGIHFCPYNSLVSAADGTATGETSDDKGQQGVGLGSKSHLSDVIMGGPEIVVGQVTKIQGEQFSITGDRGQDITLRVTKTRTKYVEMVKAPTPRSSNCRVLGGKDWWRV